MQTNPFTGYVASDNPKQKLPFTLAFRFSPFRSFESPFRPAESDTEELPQGHSACDADEAREPVWRTQPKPQRDVTQIKTPVRAVAGHWMPGGAFCASFWANYPHAVLGLDGRLKRPDT